MIVFSRCPECGLKIGRNSDYCPRCMKHFNPADAHSSDEDREDGKRTAVFLSRNLRRNLNNKSNIFSSQANTISPQAKNFLRLKIFFAMVLAIVIFIMIKSARTGIGLFYSIPTATSRILTQLR